MVSIDLSAAPPTGITDVVRSALDKTGILLPLLVVGLVGLAVVYNDRLVFTKPHRPGLTVPSGGLPLIGHTYAIVKYGTKNQFERFQEMALRA